MMTRRRVIRDLDADAEKADERRRRRKLLQERRPVPWDSVGMPLPGPNFMECARRLGDASEITTTRHKSSNGSSATVHSVVIGNKLQHLYDRALRDVLFELPVEVKPGLRKTVKFVPGHIWGQHADAYIKGDAIAVDGPRPADVMVIGKMPGREEEEKSRNMVGDSGRLMIEIMRDLKIKGWGNWYITNLLKFRPPDGSSTLKTAWIKDCLPLLQQELRVVRPKYILCLGADASKTLLGKKFTVGYMEGRVVEYEFDIGTGNGKGHTHKSLVMTVVHPAQIIRSHGQDQRRTLERGLARFNVLRNGKRFDLIETDIDHRTIMTLEELTTLLYEVEHDPEKEDDVIAVDAEWHGEHPVNEGSYVRTVQFAWRPKHACAVVLNAPGGENCFTDAEGKPAQQRAMLLLKTFFSGGLVRLPNGSKFRCRRKRVVGHFFNADLEWLIAIGLDLREEFAVPLWDKPLEEMPPPARRQLHKWGYREGDLIPAWLQTNWLGGADTGLMSHAIEETASYPLESLLMRYTDVPRYDIALQDWKTAHCAQLGIKAKDLEGYGLCPDSVLVSYGIYDADGDLRLFYELDSYLNNDYDGNVCREPFWESMIAAPAVLDIHRNGVAVDKQRIDDLTVIFMDAKDRMEARIRKWARWPEFNVRSVMQVREFLFGEKYNGKKTADGEVVKIRPAGARCLSVVPFMDTSKPPVLWSEVKHKGLESERTAGTGKAILSILSQDNETESDQINWIRDYRFLDQVLKSTLRPPLEYDDGSWVTEGDVGDDASAFEYTSFGGGLGGLIYDAGLASQICSDGRVRTHIYQTKETGRWSSARPPLQNLSKQRDPDYLRMLGSAYKHKLRSIIKASPGHVLIEADYTGAELFGMAIMAGDETMIEHCRRNQLPEDNPDFYDIHSNVAVLALGLSCPATKAGLKSVPNPRNPKDPDGCLFLRVLAKSVVFGLAYGRGAKAIALAAREQKTLITAIEAQHVIDTIFSMYPKLLPFFEECRRRALDEGWLCNCFGRFRRFPHASDRMHAGEFERQAMNYPIQSMIASAMSRAIAYLHYYKEHVESGLYRILLQIHDAVLLEARYQNVERVVDHVLPLTMRHWVPICPTTLAGVPTGEGPYHLGIDREVMTHWGERVSREYCERNGIPCITAGGLKIAASE